jgi:hypothetical protein
MFCASRPGGRSYRTLRLVEHPDGPDAPMTREQLAAFLDRAGLTD